MQKDYNPTVVETDAQNYWQEHQCFAVTERPGAHKFYCLAMFPYPSGRLHMGHVRNYTIGDTIARYRRMLGDNVLQPMGWDAFGLPAENAAIENNILPEVWTRDNIDAMREQFQRLGFAYDWRREFATCDPGYYRWEQWFFLRLYEKGIVYRKKALVNWDPVDQTVLANEQVIDGRGWRSGAEVEQRDVSQWFLRITDYAEELLEDLKQLEGHWPPQVLQMQRNWIGRSQGAEIHFPVDGQNEPLTVFTTRPDTLMGATYLALAPGHPWVQEQAKQDAKLARFVQQALSRSDGYREEKIGHPLNLTARHPLTDQPLPVWVANFVLMEYGSGAVMSVPAHDQRDWEFAQAYQLPMVQVIAPADGSSADIESAAYVEHGVLIESGDFTGLTSAQAFDAIVEALAKKEQGHSVTRYRLHDWGVSRQRHWGCPIPMIHCPECGIVPVPEADLPIVLGSNSRAHERALNTPCPKCGTVAQRETDTFDTFVESSWYQARFCSYDASTMLDERARYWLPVDQYIGGIEHALLHLLYARFFHKLMRDEGLVEGGEPFAHLLTQGMVLKDGYKMSKSRGNVVDPQPLIDRYGADTVRLFILFAAPPENSLEWSDQGVEGCHRFLKRFWHFVYNYVNFPTGKETPAPNPEPLQQEMQTALRRKLHETIGKVSHVVQERHTFNTAIAANMELLNDLTQLRESGASEPSLIHECLEAMLKMLAPMVPHITHVLWQALGHTDALINQPWPQADKKALVRTEETLVIQINGKTRAQMELAVDLTEAQIEQRVRENSKVSRWLEEGTVARIIHVPHKLINLVVK